MKILKIANKVVKALMEPDIPFDSITKKSPQDIVKLANYVYDPEHKNKPIGNYHKTERGWSDIVEKQIEYTKKQLEQIQSPQFQDFFKGSKVVDKKGNPLIVYHGTPKNFDAFDENVKSTGVEQYGKGFYFTTNKELAKGYSSPKEGDKGNLIEAFISLKNPIIVNANEHQTLNGVLNLSKTKIMQLISKAPKIKDKEESPLGDFYPEYWETGPKTWMFEDLAKKYDSQHLYALANDFYRGEDVAFQKNLAKVTGHDGVIVNFDEQSYVIPWSPEQIKSATENNGKFDKYSKNFKE